MKFTKELIEKAKAAKSAEELQNMAKAENIELSVDEATKAFAKLHQTGELADDELDNVSGGCSDNPSPDGVVDSEEKVEFLYNIDDVVEIIMTFGTERGVITDRFVGQAHGGYEPQYRVSCAYGVLTVRQRGIQIP